MSDRLAHNCDDPKKARGPVAIESPPVVNLVDSSAETLTDGPVLISGDSKEGNNELFPWRRVSGDAENEQLEPAVATLPPAKTEEGASPPLIVGLLPPDDIVVPKKRSQFWWKPFAWLVLLIVVPALWGNQFIETVDYALTRNPYTSLPVAELIKPLRNEKQRSTYWAAVQSIAKGVLSVPNAFPSRGNTRGMDWYRAGLTDLEKIGQTSNPLYAFGVVHSTDAEYRSGLYKDKSEEDLQAAVELAAKSIGPRNMLVAEALRHQSIYYLQPDSTAALAQAERCIKSAIEIDEAGGGRNTEAMLRNKSILAKVYELQRSPLADQTWSELVDVSAKHYGEKSHSHARTLLDYAEHLIDQGSLSKSFGPANQAAEILLETLGNQIEWHNFLPSIGTPDRALRSYLRRAHSTPLSKALATSPPGTTAESLQSQLNVVDKRFLDWHRKACGYGMHFDVLVSFADEYNSGRNYLQADRLYKSALNFTQDAVRSGAFSKTGRRSVRALNDNELASDRYVLCMAKTARNCVQLNNLHEAAVIANNCIAVTDPYNSWRPHYDYGFALEQLVYALGPLPKELHSAEITRVTEALAKRLECGYGRAFVTRRHGDSPWKSGAMLRAELAELQGDLPTSEAYYKKTVLDRETSTTCGALGAFYMKIGRYDDAAKLLAKSEYLSTKSSLRSTIVAFGTGSIHSGTTVNLSRMKRLIEAVPIQQQLNSFEWFPSVRADIANAQTSVELGRRLINLDLRPLITDCRDPDSLHDSEKTPSIRSQGEVSQRVGYAYYVTSARADLQSLPKDKQEIAQQMFKWYQICFPKSQVEQAKSLAKLRESLPSAPVSGLANQPLSPADLVPLHLLIISEGDFSKLHRLLGRPASTSSGAPVKSLIEEVGVSKLFRKFNYNRQP
ncbi:MAG: hypothetical protein K2W95_30865 [Candidatus Obscuribacterales bacterium]|nr:hypothetical protein [Candidatus Obscuribacterales bacterium]